MFDDSNFASSYSGVPFLQALSKSFTFLLISDQTFRSSFGLSCKTEGSIPPLSSALSFTRSIKIASPRS